MTLPSGVKVSLPNLKSLGGSNIVKVVPAGGNASGVRVAEKRLKVVCGTNTSFLDDMAWISEKTPLSLCEVRVSPSNTVSPNLGVLELSEVLSRVIPFTAKEDNRPVLQCVLLRVAEGKLMIVSADGFRLSVVKLDFDGEDGQVLINRDELRGVISALRRAYRVRVSFEKNGESLDGMSLLLDTELIRYKWRGADGNFPEYEKLIPAEFNTFVSFDANEAIKAVNSLKVLSDSKAYPIDLTIGNGKLTMSSPDDKGLAEIPADTLGDGKKVVNQAQAAALRQAGDIILSEGRSGPAAKWLNEQGWRTTTGKLFSPTTLACKGGTFRNRALVGETIISFEEKQVVICHDAIMDVAKFEAINAVLDGRRLREPRSAAFYALTGIASCGCGAKWEPCHTGKHRYYRCTAHCGEKWRRKEAFEQEVWDSFGDYLKERQGRADYLELAQQSVAKLRAELGKIERDIDTNALEWDALLDKDLTGYPAETVEKKKAKLNAARESLGWRKAEIEGQLLLLPQVNADEVERELATLGEPWLMCDWSTPVETPHGSLSREQAGILRQTLLRLGAEVHVERGEIRIIGRLPVGVGAKVGAKAGASGEASAHLPSRRVLQHEQRRHPSIDEG